jgi:hypothetical protein
MSQQIRTSQIKKKESSRCPACLDSIHPQDATLACAKGHAHIHRECKQLINKCPSIGCDGALVESRIPDLANSSVRRQISITKRDVFRPAMGENYRYMAIQMSRNRIKSLNGQNDGVAIVLGILTFLFLPFIVILIPAILILAHMRKSEKRSLSRMIQDFGGQEELAKYERGVASTYLSSGASRRTGRAGEI